MAEKEATKGTSGSKTVIKEPKRTQKIFHAEEIEKVQAKKKSKKVKRLKVQVVSKKKKVSSSGPSRDIGVDVNPPEGTCEDPNCPFHGELSVRGQMFTGIVVSSKMEKTAVVQKSRFFFVPKYERYEKRTRNIQVHNPSCIRAEEGDEVRIMECRPLSKTKNFVIIEKGGMA